MRVNHILFADDIFIFFRDCPETLRETMVCLTKFCKIFGHKLNLAKSHIYFLKIQCHNKEATNPG